MLSTLRRLSVCLGLLVTLGLFVGCASNGAPAPLTTSSVQRDFHVASQEVDLALSETYELDMSDVRLRLERTAKDLGETRDALADRFENLADTPEALSAARKRARDLLEQAADLRAQVKDAQS